MPDTIKYLSKITLLDGTEVRIKDAEARAAIAGGTKFLGISSTTIVDGSTINPITISGTSVTAGNGDIVAFGNKEFIYAAVDSAWHELGDMSNLGALGYKDSASGSYTPAGTVSFTGGTVQSTGSFTPSGAVSKPSIDVTPTTANITEVDAAGSVTSGTAAAFNAVYNEQTENLAFSFTPNTPTSVTLPTTKQTSVLTAIFAALHENPVFTGSSGTVNVEGTAAGSAAFTGTPATITVE